MDVILQDAVDTSVESENLAMNNQSNKWIEMKSFNSVKEFNEGFISTGYSRFRINRPLLGIKKYYKCKINNCPNKIQTYYPSESECVIVLWNGQNHLHEESESQKFDGEKIKNFLNNDLNRKPRNIQKALLANNVKVSRIQIQNFKQREKAKSCVHPSMNIAELSSWCASHHLIPEPNFPHSPFVLAYQFYEVNKFRIVITTRRLLEFANHSDLISVDATYKLVLNDFPMIVVGVSDRARVFHPIAFQISICEKEEDFDFILQSVLYGAETVNGTRCKFNYSMSDAAPAIKASVKKILGSNVKCLMCWFHMKEAVEKRLQSIAKDENRELLLNHIYVIHISKDENEFILSTGLFFNYWTEKNLSDVNLFLEYFRKYWIQNNEMWYEGAAKKHPSTNNGLESFNRVIKDEGIVRVQQLMGNFLNMMMLFLKEKSEDRAIDGGIQFNREVIIKRIDFCHAYNAYLEIKKLKVPKKGVIYINSDLTLGEKMVSFSNINEYYNYKQNCFEIEIANNITCTCSFYLKQYFCNHSISVEVITGRRYFPSYLSGDELCRKRKRGHPRKIAPALVYQEPLFVVLLVEFLLRHLDEDIATIDNNHY